MSLCTLLSFYILLERTNVDDRRRCKDYMATCTIIFSPGLLASYLLGLCYLQVHTGSSATLPQYPNCEC